MKILDVSTYNLDRKLQYGVIWASSMYIYFYISHVFLKCLESASPELITLPIPFFLSKFSFPSLVLISVNSSIYAPKARVLESSLIPPFPMFLIPSSCKIFLFLLVKYLFHVLFPMIIVITLVSLFFNGFLIFVTFKSQ